MHADALLECAEALRLSGQRSEAAVLVAEAAGIAERLGYTVAHRRALEAQRDADRVGKRALPAVRDDEERIRQPARRTQPRRHGERHEPPAVRAATGDPAGPRRLAGDVALELERQRRRGRASSVREPDRERVRAAARQRQPEVMDGERRDAAHAIVVVAESLATGSIPSAWSAVTETAKRWNADANGLPASRA